MTVRPLVGTSTKMNLTSTETAAWIERILPLTSAIDDVDLFVLPPFPAIWAARQALAGTGWAWGAQDVHPDDAGAHTGDVSAPMLADLGCTFVECGHSERRRDYGESDALIARKVAAIVRAGMTPILCVGEPTPGDTGAASAFVAAQVAADLALLTPEAVGRVVIAYEPVWAIGVGARPADPAHVEAVHAAIRRQATSMAAEPSGIRVIYGGSVDAASAPAILDRPGIDGLFVGRAALDPGNFAAIARAASSRAAGRTA
jgi:triosephosphate isomerase